MRVLGEGSAVLEPIDGSPVGDEIAIMIGNVVEPGGIHSVPVWRFDVDAETVTGSRVRVGSVTTCPSASLLGRGAMRVAAGAYFPGARRWFVRAVDQANGNRASSTCDIEISSSPVRSPQAHGRAGAWSIAADGLDLYDAPADVPAAVVYGPSYIAPFAQILLGAWGSNEGAARRWVQLFDGGPLLAPLAGLAPLESVGTDPGASWSIVSEDGIRLRTGLVLVVSSTPDVLTYDAAATFLLQRRTRTLLLGS